VNIFLLSRDVQECAESHCDKHVVKMILEYAQLLSTAHHVISPNLVPSGIYKKTHVNHPSAIWTRSNIGSYMFVLDLAKSLLAEYTYRYSKVHKSSEVIQTLRQLPIGIQSGSVDFDSFPQCMPDECKVPGKPVAAYRNYYVRHKHQIANWKLIHRQPNWYGRLHYDFHAKDIIENASLSL